MSIVRQIGMGTFHYDEKLEGEKTDFYTCQSGTLDRQVEIPYSPREVIRPDRGAEVRGPRRIDDENDHH
jgi:hypothetical protein